ncbi:uncharacterized protein LOC142497489 [Ascaphus truei]|uniref:uncharacterized protein LOC142497489 n=1 Tax=Ascaphus truei TaxID=8439 RepID=UPI003F59D5C2
MDSVLQTEVLIVVLQKKKGVLCEEFAGLFHRTHGYQFKLSHYGYTSLKSLLNDMKDLVVLQETTNGCLIKCLSPSQHTILYIGGTDESQEDVQRPASEKSAPHLTSKLEKVHLNTSLPVKETHASSLSSRDQELPKIQVPSTERQNEKQLSSVQSKMLTKGAKTLVPVQKDVSSTKNRLESKAGENVSQSPAHIRDITFTNSSKGNVASLQKKTLGDKMNKPEETHKQTKSVPEIQKQNRQPQSTPKNPSISTKPVTCTKSSQRPLEQRDTKIIYSGTKQNIPCNSLSAEKQSVQNRSNLHITPRRAYNPINKTQNEHGNPNSIQMSSAGLTYAKVCTINIKATPFATTGCMLRNAEQLSKHNTNSNLLKIHTAQVNSFNSKTEPKKTLNLKMKENIINVLKVHTYGISTFQLQKMYYFIFQEPLHLNGFSSVQQLLRELKDVAEIQGVGVQTLVFPKSSEIMPSITMDKPHSVSLLMQEADSAPAKQDWKTDVMVPAVHISSSQSTEKNDTVQLVSEEIKKASIPLVNQEAVVHVSPGNRPKSPLTIVKERHPLLPHSLGQVSSSKHDQLKSPEEGTDCSEEKRRSDEQSKQGITKHSSKNKVVTSAPMARLFTDSINVSSKVEPVMYKKSTTPAALTESSSHDQGGNTVQLDRDQWPDLSRGHHTLKRPKQLGSPPLPLHKEIKDTHLPNRPRSAESPSSQLHQQTSDANVINWPRSAESPSSQLHQQTSDANVINWPRSAESPSSQLHQQTSDTNVINWPRSAESPSSQLHQQTSDTNGINRPRSAESPSSQLQQQTSDTHVINWPRASESPSSQSQQKVSYSQIAVGPRQTSSPSSEKHQLVSDSSIINTPIASGYPYLHSTHKVSDSSIIYTPSVSEYPYLHSQQKESDSSTANSAKQTGSPSSQKHQQVSDSCNLDSPIQTQYPSWQTHEETSEQPCSIL